MVLSDVARVALNGEREATAVGRRWRTREEEDEEDEEVEEREPKEREGPRHVGEEVEDARGEGEEGGRGEGERAQKNVQRVMVAAAPSPEVKEVTTTRVASMTPRQIRLLDGYQLLLPRTTRGPP